MRTIKMFIGILGVLLATFVGAQDLREGKDYRTINPAQPTEAGKGKVEVIEFFWYGCPHCFDFEPLLNKWLMNMPKDVVFRRIHALFPGERWKVETKTYYALETLGLLDKMHQDVFAAFHVDRVRLNDEATLFAWMEKKGVERKKFEEAYNSFSVQSKTQRSLQLSQAYQLQGVPALVVNGKYMPGSGSSYEELLVTLDKLIAKSRADLGLPDPAAQPEPKATKKKAANKAEKTAKKDKAAKE